MKTIEKETIIGVTLITLILLTVFNITRFIELAVEWGVSIGNHL